ncbi:hypothetical protein FGO68_gene16493 [Halteria grandinella]|uniref:Uncharacterized protein n=1 Tax=Halteria grandinella TaxID=5974 RepID=A0A8J8NZ87_HALGN|nr:hypothetical protein FGO68_gene16493 [Halteria grandinella]
MPRLIHFKINLPRGLEEGNQYLNQLVALDKSIKSQSQYHKMKMTERVIAEILFSKELVMANPMLPRPLHPVIKF